MLNGSTQQTSKKMIAALREYRAYEWWFRTENPEPGSRCLSPMVLQNMKLRYESGDLSPNLMQFENLLQTAIFYQQRCRQMHGEIEDLRNPRE